MLLKSYLHPEYSHGWLINRKAAEAKTAAIVQQYNVKLAGLSQPVRAMSGGNLQKLLLAREISEQPKLIIVVYPARGLDVGATESIHKLLTELRDQGTAILLISEDLDELMKLSDRVGVMFGGRIVGNFPIEGIDAILDMRSCSPDISPRLIRLIRVLEQHKTVTAENVQRRIVIVLNLFLCGFDVREKANLTLTSCI